MQLHAAAAAARAALVELAGPDNDELGAASLDELAAEIALHGPVELFVDACATTSVTTSVSERWTPCAPRPARGLAERAGVESPPSVLPRPRPASIALALASGLWAPAASAQPATLESRLSVARGQGAEDCPDAARLAAQIEPLLSGSTLGDVRIDVQIGRGEAGYEANVRASGGRVGRRAIADAGPTCGALADALAVAVAMILDGRDELPPAPPPAPSPPPPAPAPPPAMTGARQALSLAAVVSAESTVGIIALGSTGPAVEAALRWPGGVEIGLGASALPASTYAEPPGEIRVSLLAARARGCFLWESPSVSAGGCALGLAGQMTGEGAGYYRDHSPSVAWGALGFGTVLRGSLAGDIGWQAEAGGLVPLRRQSYSVDRVSDGPVFEQPALGGFARLGLWAKIF